MSYRLTEGNKVRLKGKIVKGAQNFEKYLNGKCFKIICEDGMQTEIRFFQDDFKHLTGIESNLSEYYGAAEPPVRCGESHLSGLTEPPHFIY